ncbi:glycoside hydrolase family 2 TIM barrel-domain containing protein [Paenibacillus sp. YYML68]|uniref:glycoside hydrolase family 2 TIM barrel-domain containing protein n=1 Tax=Paenibacillus sp. YYML68 TaxID=2909250 RepID=UPI0024926AF1|nr:glycoside hydrolase family 2 TIM barrel-domain containing protein [Paenibacillus sp. YYML68]
MRGLPINDNWKFILDEPEAPHLLTTDDSSWRTVQLPHDWSVEQPFDQEKGEACTGYLLGGIGWYRRSFKTTEAMAGQRVFVNFDGIYNRASIYCNGTLVRFHPYGYSPCVVDLTAALNPLGKENVIAVRVDHSRYADSRWYTGSGIYRKVSMHIVPQVHIPVWGTFYTTPEVSDESATVRGVMTVRNDSERDETVEIVGRLYGPNGEQVAEQKATCHVSKQGQVEVTLDYTVSQPERWEIHQAKLYRAQADVVLGCKVIQTETDTIGIREFRFDADKGFFFNGRRTLIKGVCLHHDGGLVGAAVPLDVWRRRLEKLAVCGCNAIRTAHNPMSEDFMDLCDEMGFLVQVEFFDEWDHPKDKRRNGGEQSVDYLTRGHAEYFREYAQQDLQDTMRRDRNHPCVIQWSIGNEIEWTYPKYNVATGYFGMNASGNYFWTLPPNSRDQIREIIQATPRDHYDIDKTAHQLARWTREMDTTRPVIANCILPSASYESGYIDALDMAGYSYRRVIYDYGHHHYPDKPIMGTENVAQWHEWKAVLEREHVPGIFLWTGIDHMGEAIQKPWPRKGSNLGLLDFAAFEKPSYHMFKSLWTNEPHLHLVTQTLEQSLYVLNEDGELVEKVEGGWQQRVWFWHDVNTHWNYSPQELVVAEVYSNCDEVSLYLNGKLLATRRLEEFEDRIYKWAVPYEAGELKAVGRKLGVTEGETHGETHSESVESALHTVGPVQHIVLEVDKATVAAHEDSVVHVIAQLMDAAGHAITNQNVTLDFEVDGPGRVLGVDNGSSDNVQPYQSTRLTTEAGRGMMLVQGVEAGELVIRATCRSMNRVSNMCKVMVHES